MGLVLSRISVIAARPTSRYSFDHRSGGARHLHIETVMLQGGGDTFFGT